jgi:cutinase-like protein
MMRAALPPRVVTASSSRRVLDVAALCQHEVVILRNVAAAVGGAAALVWVSALAAAPFAHAVGCPDVEVVFARGTTEAPGAGPVGDAFVESLRPRVGAKSVDVYGVDYPATTDFPTAVQGIADARTHVLATAANCPQTSIVLGGFSQGAAVMGFVTDSAVPDGVSPDDVPAPMPPDIADHVTAVALFGKPSTRFMHVINDPPVTVGPLYQAKTDDLCVDNDLVCDPQGRSFSAHNTYVESGLVDQAATYVTNRLQAAWAAQAAQLTTPIPGAPSPAVDAAPVPHLPGVPLPPGPVTAPQATVPSA